MAQKWVGKVPKVVVRRTVTTTTIPSKQNVQPTEVPEDLKKYSPAVQLAVINQRAVQGLNPDGTPKKK
jgi:hypothetical protein